MTRQPSPNNIAPAHIMWGEDDVPRSVEYDDVYFSPRDGLAESRYIFLEHNNLPERWKTCTKFTICETGFGTGLNFLAAWHAWRQNAPTDEHAKLHFISIEKHPLRIADLIRAHASWEELKPFANELQRNYPDIAPATHQLSLDNGRVMLTLCFGDIAEALPNLDIPSGVDAWFLDGFAPATNPDMWGDFLAHEMARLSAPHAGFSTFSAAKAVKDSLIKHGFEVHKVKGYGYKKNMLCGTYSTSADNPMREQNVRVSPERGKATRLLRSADARSRGNNIIIGGGLAGCSIAWKLATQGQHVTLIERSATLASGASGNPAGILFPLLHKLWSPLTSFYVSGYGMSRRLIRDLRENGAEIAGDVCGVIQSPKESQTDYFTDLPSMLGITEELAQTLTPSDIAARLGVNSTEIEHGGLFYPEGGWISVVDFCTTLSSHPNIDIIVEENALTLENHAGEWQLGTEGGTFYHAKNIIIANGYDAAYFSQTSDIPLHTVRGQISYVPDTHIPQDIPHVLCSVGYVTPSHNGMHCLGATYDHLGKNATTTSNDHEENHAKAQTILPSSLSASLDPTAWGGRAALRTMSRDRHPVIGKIAPGLYVSLAHGSRGVISCPLAARIIAADLLEQPAPLSSATSFAVSPKRFKTKHSPQ